ANLDDTNNVTDPFVHPKDVLCAGAQGRGINHGDSGGPLMANRGGVWYQVGINSYIDDKKPFRQDKYPATFTRVTSYCDWIEKATDGEAKCQSVP
ncbi:chymotrypsin-like serine protease precursor, partial [Aphelenchoides avenae]